MRLLLLLAVTLCGCASTQVQRAEGGLPWRWWEQQVDARVLRTIDVDGRELRVVARTLPAGVEGPNATAYNEPTYVHNYTGVASVDRTHVGIEDEAGNEILPAVYSHMLVLSDRVLLFRTFSSESVGLDGYMLFEDAFRPPHQPLNPSPPRATVDYRTNWIPRQRPFRPSGRARIHGIDLSQPLVAFERFVMTERLAPRPQPRHPGALEMEGAKELFEHGLRFSVYGADGALIARREPVLSSDDRAIPGYELYSKGDRGPGAVSTVYDERGEEVTSFLGRENIKLEGERGAFKMAFQTARSPEHPELRWFQVPGERRYEPPPGSLGAAFIEHPLLRVDDLGVRYPSTFPELRTQKVRSLGHDRWLVAYPAADGSLVWAMANGAMTEVGVPAYSDWKVVESEALRLAAGKEAAWLALKRIADGNWILQSGAPFADALEGPDLEQLVAASESMVTERRERRQSQFELARKGAAEARMRWWAEREKELDRAIAARDVDETRRLAFALGTMGIQRFVDSGLAQVADHRRAIKEWGAAMPAALKVRIQAVVDADDAKLTRAAAEERQRRLDAETAAWFARQPQGSGGTSASTSGGYSSTWQDWAASQRARASANEAVTYQRQQWQLRGEYVPKN